MVAFRPPYSQQRGRGWSELWSITNCGFIMKIYLRTVICIHLFVAVYSALTEAVDEKRFLLFAAGRPGKITAIPLYNERLPADFPLKNISVDVPRGIDYYRYCFILYIGFISRPTVLPSLMQLKIVTNGWVC